MKKTTDIKGIEDKLRSYNVLLIETDNLKIDLEGYSERLGSGEISIGSKSNNPTPGRMTAKPASSQVESVVIGSITDLDRKYFRLKECEAIIKKIDNILDRLCDRDKTLIKGFYIDKVPLIDLSIKLDRTSEHLSAVKKNILLIYFNTLI